MTGVAFAARLIRYDGSHWATDLLTSRSFKWSAEAKADLLVAFSCWVLDVDRAHQCGVETEHAYGHTSYISQSRMATKMVSFGRHSSAEHDRSLDALQIVAHQANDLSFTTSGAGSR